MKKIILTSLLMLIMIQHLFAQVDSLFYCGLDEIAQKIQQTSTLATCGVEDYGKYLTAHDTLKVLVVFAKFPDDTDEKNDLDFWPANDFPDFTDTFIDQTASENSTNWLNMTHYFDVMSMGNYQVIGDVYEITAPENLTHYYTTTESGDHNEYDYYLNQGDATKDVLEELDATTSIDFSDYDNWSVNDVCDFDKSSDGVVDMIYIIWRGKRWFGPWGGIASLGGFDTITLDGVDIMSGYGLNNGSGVTMNTIYNTSYLLNATVHEHAHWLLGATHPYGSNTPANRIWSMLQGGYPNAYHANAAERERLAWISVPEITTNTTVTLSDFLTTGEAYKIDVAATRGYANEYFYIENHQKLSDYDDATKNPNDTGIFIFHTKDNTYTHPNIKHLTSDGHYDWEFVEWTGASNQFPVFDRTAPNPDGTSYTTHLEYPVDSDTLYWLRAMDEFRDQSGDPILAGYSWGVNMIGTYNEDYRPFFAPHTNPNSGTWDGGFGEIAMEVVSQTGNDIDVKFYMDYDPWDITSSQTWSGKIYIDKEVTVSNNATLTISAGTELDIFNDFTVNAGSTLDIEEGATINFIDNNVKITVNGNFSAVGTSTDRITINGTGYTDTEIIATNGATIKYADFTQAELSVSGGNGTSIIHSTFIHAIDGVAVTLEDMDDINFFNNYVLGAAGAGLKLINVDWPGLITNNTFKQNQFGVYASNSEIEHFDGNVMEGNDNEGIRLSWGSEGWLTDSNEESSGKNRFKDNGGDQIFISSNSLAFLGDNEYHESLNSVYHLDWGITYNDYYIVNNHPSATVDARNCYWGGTPVSSMFDGSVNYSNHLPSDLTNGSGSTYAKIVMPEYEPSEQTRKERLLELISDLDEDAYRSKNDHRLSELYISMRLDRENKMELRDQILATIDEWASRRSEISSVYEDSQEVRRAVETAMLLQIRLAFRNRDYEQAGQLNEYYDAYIQLKENRLALLENEVSIQLYKKEYEPALQILDQIRTQFEGEQFVDEADWNMLEAYLRNKLGQEVNNPEKNIAEDNRNAEETKPATFALRASYPNPFNPTTIIPFELPESSQVRLEIYDLLGRRVAVLTDQIYEAGRHEISWNASTSASGVYIVRMQVNTGQGRHRQFNRQVTLLK